MPVTFENVQLPGHEGRKGRYMHLYSGNTYFPFDPRPEEISIIDIAHHLSMQCRFAGASLRFLSVAEHSVLTSYIDEQENGKPFVTMYPTHAMEKLMHDAAEAYIQDWIRPVKYDASIKPIYKALEELNEAAIAKKFRMSYPFSPAVKYADEVVCNLEMRDNIRNLNKGHLHAKIDPPSQLALKFWSPEQAKSAFLSRFIQLGGVMDIDP